MQLTWSCSLSTHLSHDGYKSIWQKSTYQHIKSFPANFMKVCGQADERDLNNVLCWEKGCRGSLTRSEQIPHMHWLAHGLAHGLLWPTHRPWPSHEKRGAQPRYRDVMGMEWWAIQAKGRGNIEIMQGKVIQGDSWWFILARGVWKAMGYWLGGSEAMEKTNVCDGVCVNFIGSKEIVCNLFAWNNNGNYFYICCFNMIFLSISLQYRQNAKLNIVSISMNFAEGL